MQCEVPKYWGINYQAKGEENAAPPNLATNMKVERVGASPLCEDILTGLGAVAGKWLIHHAIYGVYTNERTQVLCMVSAAVSSRFLLLPANSSASLARSFPLWGVPSCSYLLVAMHLLSAWDTRLFFLDIVLQAMLWNLSKS